MIGVAELIANNGLVRVQKTPLTGEEGSAKRRGVKQGAFLFLLTFLIVPILVMISVALDLEPYLPVGAMFLFGVGGVLRTVYAMTFESGIPASSIHGSAAFPAQHETRGALPDAQSIPASTYTSPAGGWRDTNDLQREPGSVTDSTTKLLEKDQPRQ